MTIQQMMLGGMPPLVVNAPSSETRYYVAFGAPPWSGQVTPAIPIEVSGGTGNYTYLWTKESGSQYVHAASTPFTEKDLILRLQSVPVVGPQTAVFRYTVGDGASSVTGTISVTVNVSVSA